MKPLLLSCLCRCLSLCSHSKGDCWLKFTEAPASPEVGKGSLPWRCGCHLHDGGREMQAGTCGLCMWRLHVLLLEVCLLQLCRAARSSPPPAFTCAGQHARPPVQGNAAAASSGASHRAVALRCGAACRFWAAAGWLVLATAHHLSKLPAAAQHPSECRAAVSMRCLWFSSQCRRAAAARRAADKRQLEPAARLVASAVLLSHPVKESCNRHNFKGKLASRLALVLPAPFRTAANAALLLCHRRLPCAGRRN